MACDIHRANCASSWSPFSSFKTHNVRHHHVHSRTLISINTEFILYKYLWKTLQKHFNINKVTRTYNWVKLLPTLVNMVHLQNLLKNLCADIISNLNSSSVSLLSFADVTVALHPRGRTLVHMLISKNKSTYFFIEAHMPAWRQNPFSLCKAASCPRVPNCIFFFTNHFYFRYSLTPLHFLWLVVTPSGLIILTFYVSQCKSF